MNKHATYQQLRGHLAYLKLAAAAEHLPGALAAAERDKPGYTQFLHDLLTVEVTATEQRRLTRRTRLAGFPSTQTLEDFDFTAQPSLDRRHVDELATLRFIEEKANVLAIGPPGTGKTMLADRQAIVVINQLNLFGHRHITLLVVVVRARESSARHLDRFGTLGRRHEAVQPPSYGLAPA